MTKSSSFQFRLAAMKFNWFHKYNNFNMKFDQLQKLRNVRGGKRINPIMQSSLTLSTAESDVDDNNNDTFNVFVQTARVQNPTMVRSITM